MQAYDDARDDAVLWVLAEDAFAGSRAAFDTLTATLASAEAGGWTHDQLEDHLETNGRELLRLLLQAPGPACPAEAARRHSGGVDPGRRRRWDLSSQGRAGPRSPLG